MEERARGNPLLANWNTDMGWNAMDAREASMTLQAALRRGREEYPERTALRFQEEIVTYGLLDEITDRVATGLLQAGIQPGDRVALLLPNGLEIVYGYYACFKIGAIAVPVNIRFKGP